YEGASGLGSQNAPGLERVASAVFTGEFPFARIDFEDAALPVNLSLEAFTPFIPHDADDSGLPAAVLRYRVTNPGPEPARVSIAFSIDNPVTHRTARPSERIGEDTRENQYRSGENIAGILMTNPGLPDSDPMQGSFALCVRDAGEGKLTRLRGWERG